MQSDPHPGQHQLFPPGAFVDGSDFELHHADGTIEFINSATVSSVTLIHLNVGYDRCYVTWQPERFSNPKQVHVCSVPVTDDCARSLLALRGMLWNNAIFEHLIIKGGY